MEEMLKAVIVAVVASGVSGLVLMWGAFRVFGWRVKELEDRMEPIDRGENSVIIRLDRLETRRRASSRG